MGDNTVAGFWAELGFKGDAAGAKKVVDLQVQTEAAITKAAEDGATKREAIESGATSKRIGLAGSLGKILAELEMQRADRATKTKADEIARAAKLNEKEAAAYEKAQQEKARKDKERRALALKETQANAAKMAAFAIKTVGTIEAVALGIVYATEKAARSMERLHYAANRSGTTPGKMTAAAYAFSQLGSTAEAGQATVGAIGSLRKNNPEGYAAALGSMGIRARDARGHLRDASDAAEDLGEAFARMQKEGGAYGYAQARGKASIFGIDEDAMQTMSDPRYRRMVEERKAIDAKTGADQNAAAEGGTAFEQTFRRLEATADSIRTKISTNLFAALTPELDKLEKWSTAHAGQIATDVSKVATSVIALADAVGKQLAKVNWDEVLKDVEGFGKRLDGQFKTMFGDDGPLILGLAGFAAAISAKILGPLHMVLSTLKLIGGAPLVGRMLAGGMGLGEGAAGATAAVGGAAVALPVVGTAAVGAVLASGDPDKAVLDGGRPDVQPQDNDLGLPSTGQPNEDRPSDTTRPKEAAAGILGWIKANAMPDFGKAYTQLKAMGFGDRLQGDDPKVKADIATIAEATKKIADKTDGVGSVGASTGGLGGSGEHFGGSTSPGASLGDRIRGSRGGGPGALTSQGQRDNAAAIRDELQKAGLPMEGQAAALGSAQTESTFNPAVPENAYNHGHHGLWQWDSTRWPKIAAWIKSQDGDPMDARWQTRAFVAEGRAKPGDPIYDGAQTSSGFAKLEGSAGNLGMAVEGMRGIERFGKGEEGGRTAHAASWLDSMRGGGGQAPKGDAAALALSMQGMGEGESARALGHVMHAGEWCADFMNGIIEKSGGKGTASAMADSFSKWGKAVSTSDAKRGDVILENSGAGTRIHHVGMATGNVKRDAAGNVTHVEMVSGNYGHMVRKNWERVDIIAGMRRGEGNPAPGTDKHADAIVRQAKRVADANLVHLAVTQRMLASSLRRGLPGVHAHPTLSASVRHSIDNSRRVVSVTHNPTYHIAGGDSRSMLADAHRQSGRGTADLVRNLNVKEV